MEASLHSQFASSISNNTTMDSKKSNKIREIVRLQQILKKWRKIANSPKASSITVGSSNKSIKFLKRTLSLSDKTGSSCEASNNGHVPKGYLAVCVGEELKRFVIPTDYLGRPAFQFLLREAEEEFGFQQTGVLRIPCEVPMFEELLKMVEEDMDTFFMQGCYSESQLNFYHQESPMCR